MKILPTDQTVTIFMKLNQHGVIYFSKMIRNAGKIIYFKSIAIHLSVQPWRHAGMMTVFQRWRVMSSGVSTTGMGNSRCDMTWGSTLNPLNQALRKGPRNMHFNKCLRLCLSTPRFENHNSKAWEWGLLFQVPTVLGGFAKRHRCLIFRKEDKWGKVSSSWFRNSDALRYSGHSAHEISRVGLVERLGCWL